MSKLILLFKKQLYAILILKDVFPMEGRPATIIKLPLGRLIIILSRSIKPDLIVLCFNI